MNKWSALLKKHAAAGTAAAVLLFCGILYCVTLWQLSSAESFCGGLTQVRMNGSPLTAEQAEDIAKQRRTEAETESVSDANAGSAGVRELRYTAWTERKGEILKNTDLGRTAKANVIYCSGDDSPRFHLALDNGCAVSEETAFALWGTAEEGKLLGSTVEIGDEEYIVEQIFQTDSPTDKWSGGAVIARWKEKAKETAGEPKENEDRGLPADQGQDMEFDVLDISHPRGEKAPVSELLMAQNLTSDLEISYDELLAMAAALRKLPLWGVVLYAAVRLILTGRKRRLQSRNAAFLLMTAAGLALPIAAALFVGAPFVVPQSFLPTMWSDFTFWSTTAEDTGKTLHDFMTMKLYGPDVWFRSVLASTALLCVLQTALLLLFCLLVKRAGWISSEGPRKGPCEWSDEGVEEWLEEALNKQAEEDEDADKESFADAAGKKDVVQAFRSGAEHLLSRIGRKRAGEQEQE